ncbi:MAG: MurR/RpiR family transcriptional regulator [Pseudomonadota bacterium]
MSSPMVRRLAEEAHRLPPQLATAARYVAENPFDAASLPMRALARTTGQPPVTFTRLARSLGLAGWEELRQTLIAEAREDLEAAREAPFSSRSLPTDWNGTVAGSLFNADVEAISKVRADNLDAAAAVLEDARRVFVAGYRSCYAPAMLFQYLYRLFRPDVALMGGGGGLLDLELGGLQKGDAVLLFGFAPYSRDGLLTAQAALSAGCSLVVVVDDPAAPITQGAAQALVYSAESPSYFPSLTACIALVQALAATLYLRAGAGGREQLRRSESRLAAHTAYIPNLGRDA